MKQKTIAIFIVGLLIGTGVTIVNSVSACTGFTANEPDNVLVGCNFDWSMDFNVYLNVLPSQEGKYGYILFDIYWPWFGDPNGILPIQGINDQGLFFDTYETPHHEPINSKDKPIFSSDDPDFNTYGWMGILPYCLATCSSVSEVVEVFGQYNHELMTEGQCFFVDNNGNAVIIEGDDIIYKEGNYQVVTNFLRSHPELGDIARGFERYDTAVSMLENMTELNRDYFASICDATHQSSTVFSNVYNLKQIALTTYHFYDYTKSIDFNLSQELAKGRSRTYLGSFFEPENNNPPETPNAPTGNESGSPGETIEYRCSLIKDPDGDKVTYLFDWGDGTDSGWLPKQTFSAKASHNWTDEGTFEVKVKAMDIYGQESEWSDPLVVSMPKSKTSHAILMQFFEQYMNLPSLLRIFLIQR